MSDSPASVTTDAKAAPRTLRLRTLLTVPFVLLIVAPALIIAGSSLYTGLQAVDVLSRQLMDDISARVGQAAVHQLEEAAITLRATFPNVDDNHNASIELFADKERLERKLFEMTAATRTTAYLYFGREDGSFVGVDRGRPGARAAATVRLQDGGGAPRKNYTSRAPGDRTRLLETESRIFDARNRPWYLLAKSAQRLVWTPIYVSFASGALVTTAAQPVVTATGSLFGVFAADVELSELSTFMKTVAVSANGVAFIVDREGLLVASSTPEQPFRTEAGVQKRVAARDSQSELVRSAAQWWRTAGRIAGNSGNSSPNIAMINATGEQVDVASRRVSGVDGIDWDIVVAVPRSDFTAPIVKSAVSMFFVVLIALAAALTLGLWVLRRVTRDVDQLVAATREVSADGLPQASPQTLLSETGVLANAFGEMVQRLRQSLDTIRSQNDQFALLNATLEDRVERRTTQLAEQNMTLTEEILRRERLERELRSTSQAAHKAAEDKARFLAILSHELRTPLQAVVGASQLLAANTSLRQIKEVETLDAASKSLLTLIDGVLSYSRLESGVVTPVLKDFRLSTCIEEATRVARAALSRPAVELDIQIDSGVPAAIRTDEGMLRQILINLLGNALKFTERGSIRIDVRADRPGETGAPTLLRFVVTDSGAGIDAVTQKRLFQPFQQGMGDSGTPASGSGLGLVICAMLVRALDGNISMSSEPGRGTRIEFSVLAQMASVRALDAQSALAAQTDAAASLSDILDVLIVEDHAVNRELLTIMVGQLGHRVQAAADGEAAILAALAQSFDIILMDLNLPRVGGIEATRRILQNSLNHAQAPRIVALTASVSDADRALCTAAGMRGFLTKPATVFSIEAALRKALADESSSDATDGETDSRLLDETTLESLRELDQRAREPFLQRLIERFLASLPEELALIEKASTANQRKAMSAAAHSLAGAASAVGASALARSARELSSTPSPALLLRTQSIARKTVAALLHWCQTLPAQGERPL